MECAACERDLGLEPVPRWKAPFLFVGTLLFCPCHLPVTFALLASVGTALTGATWLFGNRPLVYGVFALLYFVFLFLFLRWVLSARDRERRLGRRHARHEAQG
jgi:membrane protein implicated in regulation of membrane protease activity